MHFHKLYLMPWSGWTGFESHPECIIMHAPCMPLFITHSQVLPSWNYIAELNDQNNLTIHLQTNLILLIKYKYMGHNSKVQHIESFLMRQQTLHQHIPTFTLIILTKIIKCYKLFCCQLSIDLGYIPRLHPLMWVCQ